MASDTEITKVRIVIRHLLWQIREIRNDRDAAWKWVNRFANTLQYQELEQDPDQYALAILAEARSFNDQQRRKGQMLGVRKQLAKEGVTNPTQEQLDEKWLEMYGNEFPQDAPNGNAGVDMSDARNGAASKSPTSCDQFTADGDIREDSQAKPDGSAITRNETRAHDALGPSANHYGDIRDDSRGRYAPPSCSPDDGKLYDQETYRVSTDEARQSRQVSATADALVNQTRAGAGAQALDSPSSHPSPVRNLPRNKEEVRLFAIDNGLDVDDANDWAEMNLRERHGRDKDGKPIRNWKGAILNYCKAMAAKRETA